MLDNPYRFLEIRAASHPNGIAIIEGANSDTEITFSQLLQMTDSLAGQLFALGVQRGSRVALQLERKWSWILTLALWRLGATSAASSGMGKNFGDFGVTHVVSQHEQTEFDGGWIAVKENWLEEAVSFPPYGRVEPFDSDHPWPVIALTSGTTGKPKQVPISLPSLITRAERAAERNLTDRPVVFLVGTGTHFGQLLQLICLMRGWPVCVILPRHDELKDLPAVIERFEIETLAGAPGQIEGALATVGSQLKRSKHLKRLYMGGGLIPESLRDEAIRSFGWRIFTTFASTEVSTITARELRLNDNPRNLGLPVEEAQVQLVDEKNQLVQPGQAGRLRVRSDVMIDGYLNNAEATSRVFHDGWFYPGDMARLLPSGEYLFEGREGEAINLGGLKVDPSVIDAYLVTHPKIRDAGTFGVEVNGEVRFIASAVVLSERVEIKELMDFAKREFGERSPWVIFAAPAIPRNEMNKVMRRKLTEAHSASIVKKMREHREGGG